MLTAPRAWTPIKTDNGGTTLPPMYIYRFNGPEYLYCRECSHAIRLVYRTKSGVRCLNCGQVVNLVTP